MGKSKEKKAISRSPAEFFAENKSIAGFDNPGKSTFTTVREFVENSLDAAEDGNHLPSISVSIEAVPVAVARPNLYGKVDIEEDKGEDAAKKGKRKRSAAYYRVTVRDNGIGMPHDSVPDMLGRVLSGTKYGVKQARGRFGLGAKMALIWSKMTTSGELEIYTAQAHRSQITHCQLDIDLHKNEPRIKKHDRLPNNGSVSSQHGGNFPDGWHGAEISVMFEGNWTTGMGAPSRANVIKYMRQLAVITPYAEFTLHYKDPAASKNDLHVKFRRRSHKMPEPPKLVKHHPSSVSLTKLEELVRMAREKNDNMTLKKFLMSSFTHINKGKVDDLVDLLGKKFQSEQSIETIDKKMWMHLQSILKKEDWPAPDGSVLSPAGGYNMYLGIVKEFRPDIVVTYQEATRVYEGHPFIVEAAVSLGGKTLSPGINVIRFANRIPLIFETGSDVITKTANDIKWGLYKINQKEQKVGVFVSIVSTKIPFKGTGKEFISNDCTEIKEAVRDAIAKCGSQLKAKIIQAEKKKTQQNRRKELFRYVPNACQSIFNVLEQCANDLEDDEPPPKRLRSSDEDHKASMELVKKINDGQVTASTLNLKLKEHVEQYDETEALEYMAKLGKHHADMAPEALYIAPVQDNSGPTKRPLLVAQKNNQYHLLRKSCNVLSLP
eukprot:m.18536 g.18536  ORF g.18536 m.18536 type:complete len:662 (+) comp6348_c0_seq1:168-2153(+)